MEEKENIKWHPAFYGAIEYELREDREHLYFEPEHQLSKEPLSMDILIIKKPGYIKIKRTIGWIFKENNIVEYKSPDDGLTIDSFYKTIAYACLYKGLGRNVDAIPSDAISISIFQSSYPRELINKLKKMGATVSNDYQGIYYIFGIINIPTQIIVTSQLPEKEYMAFKVLKRNASIGDVRRFVADIAGLNLPIDRQNTDAVLQASVSANHELYDQVRKESIMCEALKELMKDEIEKEVNEKVAKEIKEKVEKEVKEKVEKEVKKEVTKGRKEERLVVLCSLVHDGLIDVKEAAKRANVTEKVFNSGLKKIYG